MMYTEDEYLLLSGIQHFAFCRRQWGLIHIEQQWKENLRTVEGKILHEHAHDSSFREKRGDLLIVRGMAVSSPELGISGECDVVEFRKCDEGVTIAGREGKYSISPVEYKRGNIKIDDCDRLQLTAQAMCLEHMLCCHISKGYLYYGEIGHREEVEINDELRNMTVKMIAEMHELYAKHHTPKVKRTKACNACSLKDLCLPVIEKKENVMRYLNKRLFEQEDGDEKIT